MKTKKVEHGKYMITVQRATALIGMRRTRVKVEQQALARDEEDVDVRWLRTFVYPDCVAPVVESAGFEVWPVPFEAFAELPDDFINQWENAVYALNPHWLPAPAEDAEAVNEKKGSSPSSSTDS